MSKLHETCIIVRLSLTAWTGEKLERNIRDQVENANNAKQGTILAVKSDLLPNGTGAERDMVWTCIGDARTYHYENTLRWMNKGEALIKVPHFVDKYGPKMNALKARAEDAHKLFIGAYGARLIEAAQMRGSLYNPADYPTVQELDRRFRFDMVAYPVPSANALSNLLGGEVGAALEQEIDRAFEDAMKDAYARLHDVVGHMAETLSNPKKNFKNSLVSNVQKVCEILPALNVANDATLDGFVTEIKDMLEMATLDELRDRDSWDRADVAKTATDITERLKRFAL